MALNKQSLKLLEQVQEIISEYNFPLSLRQLYYQLVARQIIPNRQEEYRKLSRLCVIGRDKGLLAETAFADRLREVDKPSAWTDLADFMDTVINAYNKDKWQNQDTYIEIWTEKDALRGVIAPITHAYDVTLLVVRGQVSRTAIYESYQRFAKKMEGGKTCRLYYFGDFDPSGFSIYHSLVDRLQGFGPYGERIYFERLALTREQIATYNLPQDPAKQSDPNYKKFVAEYGDNVVELDALPPDALRGLIQESIEMNINRELLALVQEIERAEQTRLQSLPTF